MTPLAMYAAILGLLAFRFGLISAPGDDGAVRFISPGFAGSGAAVFLGVVAAQVFA